MLPRLALVLGGAASGKSAWAENFCYLSDLQPFYVATARGLDAETQAKIKLHQIRRGPRWKVAEAPAVLDEALHQAHSDHIVLLDCATMWLSNRLMAQVSLEDAPQAFLTQISACAAPLVVVSNEVGQGIVPENAMARAFREAQGRLNIAVAAKADLVVNVVAGLPQVLKGSLT